MGSLEKKKVGTTMVMIPPLLFLITFGPPVVMILMVLLATFLGLREFFTLTLPYAKKIERRAGIGLGVILSILISYGNGRIVPPFLVLFLLLLSLLLMGTLGDLSLTISKMGILFLGVFYIGFLLSHVSLIRSMVHGKQWALFLITTVWAGDIFAFLGGRLFGRHKLYPKISPNKTYEGLAGGIAGSIMIALPVSLLFIPQLNSGTCIMIAIALGFLGQVGDFSESMLKRSAQVKDSGTLIPGHGGMLDRLDSFLFSAPFLYYSLLYLLKEPL